MISCQVKGFNMKKVILLSLLILLVLPISFAYERDFFFEVSKGNVPGHSSNVKFGYNEDVDSAAKEMVWINGGMKIFLDNAEIINITSTSSSDAAGGPGAITLTLEGFDNNSNPLNETVNLNGVNIVQTTQEFLRVDRMFIASNGGLEYNVGDISAMAAVNGSAQAFILAERGQTGQLMFHVPAGKTAYIVRAEFSSVKTTGGQLPVVEIIGHIRTPLADWTVFIDEIDTNVDNTKETEQILSVPLPEKSDIYLTAETTHDNTQVFGRFFIVYVNNSLQENIREEEVSKMSLSVIITILFVILFYLGMLKLLSDSVFAEHGLIKTAIITLSFWLLLIPMRFAIAYNDELAGPASVSSVIDSLYTVSIYINVAITFYMVIFFIVSFARSMNPSEEGG